VVAVGLDASDGEVSWTHQHGAGATYHYASSVAVTPSGDLVLAGRETPSSEDATVRLLDPSDRSFVWSTFLDSGALDWVFDVTVDASGDVYICGFTEGSFPTFTNAGSGDWLVAKLDGTDGSPLWLQQFGSTANEHARGIVVDGASVYVAGHTSGSLNGETQAGGTDLVLMKLDAATGSATWTLQTGTAASDGAYSLTLAPDGNVFVGGWTIGDLGGTNAGAEDALLLKVAPDKTVLKTLQFGTSGNDVIYDLEANAQGSLFLAGWTQGSIDGATTPGATDAFARRISFADLQ
jgi:hypothetical protein